MFLEQLHILYFKNIEEQELHFSKKINVLVGKNAVGKTSILDAIYYLSMTKSYFSASDVQNIQHGKDFFSIQGKFKNENEIFEVSCAFKKTEGKRVFFNQKPYQKITEHIGKIPVVMIAPQDLNLITEYADTRRKFIDALISKYDKEYLNALIQYNRALQNRNSIIKQGEIAYQQQDLIEVYNAQMAQYGEVILNKRKAFFNEVKELLKMIYQNLQDDNEELKVQYISTIQNDFLKELQYSLPKDIRLGYSATGIHRDDFEILINSYPAKNFASQGQQKSIVFAIKWLELEYLQQKTKISPVLLIDDFSDRLDNERLSKIKTLIQNDIVKQVIITDNDINKMKQLFDDDNVEFKEIKKE